MVVEVPRPELLTPTPLRPTRGDKLHGKRWTGGTFFQCLYLAPSSDDPTIRLHTERIVNGE